MEQDSDAIILLQNIVFLQGLLRSEFFLPTTILFGRSWHDPPTHQVPVAQNMIFFRDYASVFFGFSSGNSASSISMTGMPSRMG